MCVKWQIGMCRLGSARAWTLPCKASLQAAGITFTSNNFSLKASVAPVLCQQGSLGTMPKWLWSRESVLAFIHLHHKHVCAAKATHAAIGEAFQHHSLLSTALQLLSPHCFPCTRCSHYQGQNSSACAGIVPKHPKQIRSQPYLFLSLSFSVLLPPLKCLSASQTEQLHNKPSPQGC